MAHEKGLNFTKNTTTVYTATSPNILDSAIQKKISRMKDSFLTA